MTHKDFYFYVTGLCQNHILRDDAWHHPPITNIYESEGSWVVQATKALGPAFLCSRKTLVKGLKNAYDLVFRDMPEHRDYFKKQMRETLECVLIPEVAFGVLALRFPQTYMVHDYFDDARKPGQRVTAKGMMVDILRTKEL